MHIIIKRFLAYYNNKHDGSCARVLAGQLANQPSLVSYGAGQVLNIIKNRADVCHIRAGRPGHMAHIF